MSKNNLVLIHVLFWVVLFIKSSFLELTGSGLFIITKPSIGWKLHILVSLSYHFIPIVTFYWSSYAVARILKKELKWLTKLLYIILMLFVPVLARAFIEFALLKPFIGFDNYQGNNNFSWSFFIFNALFFYWDIILFGATYAVFMNWRKTEKQKQDQAIMHKAAELDFLKSQLNPHFLFNSLNDIYALVIKKSDKAQEAITQLSDLLRYALYESILPEVPLDKEITYINNYLSLQKTGYEGKFYCRFTSTGDSNGKMIAPLLLLPFVENACKHGITNEEEVPIEITLLVSKQELLFKISNRTRKMQKDKMGGIGLENVKKRLNLLYPGRHLLTM
ncbi:MAG: sensor histidine kinase, partial [Chitinophagaceae bacterium]